MKFCTRCGKDLPDEAVVCPSCGCSVNSLPTAQTLQVKPLVKFCNHCGAQVMNEAVICTKCGCSLQSQNQVRGSTGLQTAAKVFMILSCVFYGLIGFAYILIGISNILVFVLAPFLWSVPMTVSYCNAIKNNRPVGVGFKICTLLFVDFIAGILMLCDRGNS